MSNSPDGLSSPPRGTIASLSRRKAGIALFVIVGLMISLSQGRALAADGRASPAERLVHANGVLIVAHRGDNRDYPENTLPAFASAVAMGVDLVELDYHHSADGVPVVIHDGTLDRTTDAAKRWSAKKIKVSDKTLVELKQLDAGSWKGPEHVGTKLPTLEEALHVIQHGSTTLIERKAGDAATCIDLLRRRGLLGSVVVQAFDWKYLADCHRIEPKLVLAALGGYELTASKLDKIGASGARIVVWHHESLDRKAIQAIHDRGWRAWTFTVNDPRRAKELIKAGIDGIITNEPVKMLALLEQQGLRARVPPAACHSEPACCRSPARSCHLPRRGGRTCCRGRKRCNSPRFAGLLNRR